MIKCRSMIQTLNFNPKGFALICSLICTSQVLAQPDAMIGSLPTIQNWTVGNPVDGLHAYTFARTICNIGDAPLDWFVGPNTNHPVTCGNLYRLHDGRFEQIGQGWVMHHFCALQQSLCGECRPVGNCCCAQLGAGCSTANSAPTTGSFGNLGPRSEINVHMGTNPGNHSFSKGSVELRGRNIVREDDLDDDNYPGALFFAETQIVSADDAQAGDMSGDNDNASHRRAIVNQNNFFMGLTGSTFRGEPAIHAWPANDDNVVLEPVDIPNEGRLHLAHKVSDNGDGTWHYEYALHNLSSERAVGSFSVPVPDDVTVTNIGFHDIDNHSGEIYDNTDWPAVRENGAISWATVAFDENENANAIRWGTLYNFRFDADTPPQQMPVTISIFQPGTPESVSTMIAAPQPACPAPAMISPPVGTSFADHAFDGYIDPRAESTDGQSVNLGIDTVKLVFNTPLERVDGEPLDATAFGASNGITITNIATEDARTITLSLSGPLPVQQWTTITINARSQCGQTPLADIDINIGFLPGDIDQNGIVTPVDLLRFRQYLNETSTPSIGSVANYIDTDRDGEINPLDLYRYRQLINGVSPSTQVWAGQSLQAKP